MRALPLHRRFLPFFLPVLFSRGVGLSSLSVPSRPPFPSSDPAPHQSPAAGARPLPAGSGGVGAFRPRRVWPFADELVPLGDGEFIALSEFHCPGGELGISTENLAFNFVEGGGLDVDTVKLLLIAQQKRRVQAALGGSFQKETHISPHLLLLELGWELLPSQRQSGTGLGVPCCHPAVWGKCVALGRYEGIGALKAAVRCLCGLFKQLEDPPSNQRKSCHRHPQQAIKSDFPFQGSLVPLPGFSPLCKHTHT